MPQPPPAHSEDCQQCTAYWRVSVGVYVHVHMCMSESERERERERERKGGREKVCMYICLFITA